MSSDTLDNDVPMHFLDEAPEAAVQIQKKVWRVLIIDDEKDVHSATTFALRSTEVVGRHLEFLHAVNAREAEEVLRQHRDIAVVLLDVVMETPNAGLDLVEVIREDLGIKDTRIILRTGQPNQAPEIEVIRDYDINDYKLKSELNQSQLFSSLTTAIRSYKQIRTIEAGKKSLGMIVKSSAELLTEKGLRDFAQGVIVHLSGLLSIAPEGLICARRRVKDQEMLQIIAAAGHFRPLIDRPLFELTEVTAQLCLTQSLEEKRTILSQQGVALYIGSKERGDMACFVCGNADLSEVDENLLELFCSNISICADNLELVAKLSEYAYVDMLTSLPNRNALVHTIDTSLPEQHNEFLLCILDIDNFAEINASLGQSYGDTLLKAFAVRLREMFPAPCFVARVAGDAFSIYGPEKTLSKSNILGLFKKPFIIESEEQIISATTGVVSISEVHGRGDEAIKDATIVLKTAKNYNRGDVLIFHHEMVEDAQDRLALLRHLRSAFELDQLFMVFQPKIRIADNSVAGFESLVRWRNSSGEFISPESFIPLAEQSGLIVRMGAWILSESIKSLKALHAQGWAQLDMSVNLSVAQLQSTNIRSVLAMVIEQHQVAPQNITLEITESIAIDDLASTIELLSDIKSMGFSLSLDDFGTGYSSLNHLHKMPIDYLKLDRSLVAESAGDEGLSVLEMIVDLANKLNLEVIAEGVEKQSEVNLLKTLGCSQAQGFYYAKPMESKDLIDWLSAYERSRVVVQQ